MLINPRIDRTTPVIVQGITGRAGQLHTRLMKSYGTNIVAGVSPKAAGKDVEGIPVFADCASAVSATGATTCVAFVGAYDLASAVEDAIAGGVRHIVTPTEGMPVHDAMRVKRMTMDAGTVWIGGSTPGTAVAGEAKLGFLPEASLMPGSVGLMSKSGTLSYEAGYRLAQGGIGTSIGSASAEIPSRASATPTWSRFSRRTSARSACWSSAKSGGMKRRNLQRRWCASGLPSRYSR